MNRLIPEEKDVTPLPDEAPGADGDRDEEEPEVMTPARFRQLFDNGFNARDELHFYHSHLCPCPACMEAEAQRSSKMSEWLKIATQW